jgi:myosin heavy subunit
MKGLQIQIEEQERSLADAQKEVRAASEEVDSVNNALSASETECSQLRGEIASLKSQNDILSKNASAASVREVSSSSKSMTQRHRFSSTARTDDEDDEYDGEGSELEDKRRSPRAPQVDSKPKKANLLKIPNAYEQTVPILLNYVDAFPDLWHIFVESLYMSHNCTPMYEEWKETCIQIIPNLEGFLDKLESSALGSSTEGMESSEAKLINQHNESILELIACQREWISHLHEALYKITSHSEVIGAKGGSRQSSPKRASSTAANKLWANIDEEGGETAVIPEADLQVRVRFVYAGTVYSIDKTRILANR